MLKIEAQWDRQSPWAISPGNIPEAIVCHIGLKGVTIMRDEASPGKQCKVCEALNCERQAYTGGYCSRHYQQIRRNGRLTPEREYSKRGHYCKAASCQEPQAARGYCFRHYQQVRRHGRLTPERERIWGRTGCKVSGCPDAHVARGYCKHHYMSHYYLPRRQEVE